MYLNSSFFLAFISELTCIGVMFIIADYYVNMYCTGVKSLTYNMTFEDSFFLKNVHVKLNIKPKITTKAHQQLYFYCAVYQIITTNYLAV